jgi:hypothetical protein
MLRNLLLAAILLLASCSVVHASEPIEVYIGDGCSCCGEWAKYMKKKGFMVRAHNVTSDQLARVKKEAGVAEKYASCHTAKVGGYVVEGHVPAEDVRRLLAEKPDALGVSVPGMPIGSPGMEQGDTKEPYDVLLLRKDGTAEVYAKH